MNFFSKLFNNNNSNRKNSDLDNNIYELLIENESDNLDIEKPRSNSIGKNIEYLNSTNKNKIVIDIDENIKRIQSHIKHNYFNNIDGQLPEYKTRINNLMKILTQNNLIEFTNNEISNIIKNNDNIIKFLIDNDKLSDIQLIMYITELAKNIPENYESICHIIEYTNNNISFNSNYLFKFIISSSYLGSEIIDIIEVIIGHPTFIIENDYIYLLYLTYLRYNQLKNIINLMEIDNMRTNKIEMMNHILEIIRAHEPI